MDDVIAAYKKKYPNIPDVELFPPSDNDGPARNRDPNLEFDDEADAYNKFKSHGFFTPNPETSESLSTYITYACSSIVRGINFSKIPVN
jgi:hypothetical protein